ncbi:MAG: DUF547 domain-containing protein [SAR324 cluster bacterium]|nr:DUF547 domain-containing protein [SAR324 cluster bacterium]
MPRWISLTLFSLFICVTTVFSAPKSDLWPRWQSNNAENSDAIDHSSWQIFLDKYLVSNSLNTQSSTISGINRVRYAAVSKKARGLLHNYLKTLEGTFISSFSRPQQRAFWINLYNASTVNLILGHYPLESITKISFGFLASVPGIKNCLLLRVQNFH